MAAARVTNIDMPPKVTGDELLATEVEAIRRVVNSHADELDNGPVLAKALTLLAAKALATGSKVTAGVRYAITGPWNGDTTHTTVYVFGLNSAAFDSAGAVLIGGKAQAVTVDVANATWELTPPLTATQLAQVAALSKPFYALRANDLIGYDSLYDAASAGVSAVQFQRVQYTPTDAVAASDLNILSAGGNYQNTASTPLTTDGGYLNLYTTNVVYLLGGTGPIEVHNGIVDILEMVAGAEVGLFNAPVTALTGMGGTIILYPGTPDLPTPVPAGITVIDRRGGTGGGTTTTIAAPQWVAGPQKEGALVYNADSLYRVRQTIANSQVAPTATNQYYQLIGPYAGSGGAAAPDIDFASPVVHTASATLTAADFGKLHVLSGSTALTLTLPDPVAGKQIAVSVDAQSTALHTVLPPASSSLDTFSEVQAWAGELRQWAVVGTTYIKTNSRTRPMSCRLGFTGQQPVNPGFTYVQVSTVKQNVGVGMTDNASQYRIRFSRAGTWRIGYYVSLIDIDSSAYIEILTRPNGALGADTINSYPVTKLEPGSGTRYSIAEREATRTVAKGDYVDLVLYVQNGSGRIVDNVPDWLATILYAEQLNAY